MNNPPLSRQTIGLLEGGVKALNVGDIQGAGRRHNAAVCAGHAAFGHDSD